MCFLTRFFGRICCLLLFLRSFRSSDLLGWQMYHWYPYRCNAISLMFVSSLSSSMRIKCIKLYCLYLWIRNGLISSFLSLSFFLCLYSFLMNIVCVCVFFFRWHFHTFFIPPSSHYAHHTNQQLYTLWRLTWLLFAYNANMFQYSHNHDC